jgi:2-polyprenyl-6-methoxyphenol hydroxylase-like FAD-dependent oxidoreductase
MLHRASPFLGGQGSALAMTAAYLLAGELGRCQGEYSTAFLAYEQQFAPFVSRKQNAALRFAGTFVPRSQVSILFRNLIMSLMNWTLVANAVVRSDLVDRLQLPDFERSDSFAV